MCGIVGILNLRPTVPLVEERTLLSMRDSMVHRGPDSAGHWISSDHTIGLAHRRLSIIDLSEAGHQPMSNEDGSIWITFNGEIYNHRALRQQLERLGHHYRSHSDTESILHAYEEWGVQVVDHLDGMFAFALWDSTKKQLWLARDRIGKKPLYFATNAGQFIFASEIKAILKNPSIHKEVSGEGLWHYLTYAVAPAPLTLFKGIYKLPPATHLLIQTSKESLSTATDQWTFTEYWRPWAPTDCPSQNIDVYATEIRTRLEESVERRLMSDVPFGVFLSGGVDSSANVALMSRNMEQPVNTFSVGFADQAQAPYNEIQYARKIANLFKTNHHEILISDQHFFDFVDQLAYYQDEPLSDPVCFPLYYVSKLAREHGTIVIQVGEGSDELFAGYDIYRNYKRREKLYWRNFQCLPKFLRQSIRFCGTPFLHPRQATQLQRAVDGEPIFLSAALAFYDQEKLHIRNWQAVTPSASQPSLAYSGLNPSFTTLGQLFPNAKIDTLPPCQENDFLKRMISWECHQRLGELLLMRLDKMTMAQSIECRAPFLDIRIIELAMRIPSSLKIQNHIGKAVLKRALEPLLPHELVYRKKVGFCGGSGNMLTPSILQFAEKTILSTLPSHEFSVIPLEKIFKDHRSGIAENSFQIWNLLNLALWLKRWF